MHSLTSPSTLRAAQTVIEGRAAVERILRGDDDRLMIVVGPCSIHDPAMAQEYAGRLKALSEKLSDDLCIIMRAYL